MKKIIDDSSNDDESHTDELSNNSGHDEIKKLRGHFLFIETKK